MVALCPIAREQLNFLNMHLKNCLQLASCFVLWWIACSTFLDCLLFKNLRAHYGYKWNATWVSCKIQLYKRETERRGVRAERSALFQARSHICIVSTAHRPLWTSILGNNECIIWCNKFPNILLGTAVFFILHTEKTFLIPANLYCATLRMWLWKGPSISRRMAYD